MNGSLPELERDFDVRAKEYERALSLLELAQNAVVDADMTTPDADQLYIALQRAVGDANVKRATVELAKMRIEVAVLVHPKPIGFVERR